MSITSELSRLTTAKADIATAISAKGVTVPGGTKLDGMPALISQISGGGGGTPAPVSPKDVNFYDCEGTRVASYTIAEAQALAALPTQPTHSGLTGQGWNYTLAQVNAADRPMDVGAMYITDDGKTRLYIRLDKRLAVPLYFSQTVANGVTIDWGDGSSQTMAGTGNLNITHTYAVGGDYMISLDPASGCTLGLGNGSNMTVVIGGSTKYQTSIYKAEIGQRVTSIGNYAFANCCALSSIVIPSGVTSIGNNAFANCYALSSISIPSSVTSIGNYAFAGCYALSSISIPSGVTSIGNNAFYYCYSLSSVSIPSGVTSIGNNAFNSCYALSSIVILSGVTSIGDGAFANCYALSSIVIPSGVTSIGNNAFANCYALSSISIPSSVTSIRNNAFNNCYALSSIVIPSGVTSIENYAFSYCAFMKEYHFKRATPPTLGGTSVFSSIPSDCIIYVPAASLAAYKSATNWSTHAAKMVGE